jgi:hypothetical protein
MAQCPNERLLVERIPGQIRLNIDFEVKELHMEIFDIFR